MDLLAAFFMGVLFTPIGLGLLLLCALVAESSDSHGWSLFWTTVAGIGLALYFGVTGQMLAYGSLAYMVIGVVWSVWRYRRFVRSHVDKWKAQSEHHRSDTLNWLKERTSPGNNINKLMHWVISWPISMVAYLIGDLVSMLRTIVSTWIRGVYEAIHRAAVGELEQKE